MYQNRNGNEGKILTIAVGARTRACVVGVLQSSPLWQYVDGVTVSCVRDVCHAAIVFKLVIYNEYKIGWRTADDSPTFQPNGSGQALKLHACNAVLAELFGENEEVRMAA